MGQGTDNGVLGILYACVAASVLLVLLGVVLKKRGVFRNRKLGLVWAVLCVAPVFGAGFAMYLNHLTRQATGDTESGVNEPPPEGTIRR